MKEINFRNFVPHILAVIVFVLISVIYFYPAIEGYKLKQDDIQHHKGMSHEIRKHKEDLGEQTLWAGNMFGGMPSYQISAVKYSGHILPVFFDIMKLFFTLPIGAMIAYMLGFYIFLMCLKINPWLAIVGSIAFAFSSYFLIILDAGHNSKAMAIAFVPPMLGGLIYALRHKVWLGFLIFSIFLALELYANHLQITYYSIFIVIAIGLAELFHAIREKTTVDFLKRSGIILLAVALAVLANIGNLLTTYEYSKLSTRGKSELTILPNGNKIGEESAGLDTEYITNWSYGIDETFTLFISNAKGGRSGSPLADQEEIERLRKEDPAFLNVLGSEYQQFQHPLNSYWGEQPFTSGPVYIGAIVVFFAILAIIFLKTRLIIALSICLVITIMLSWGKNFLSFTNLFLEFIPAYNKFRAVSMILVVAEIILPTFAILFLDKLIRDKEFYAKNKKQLKYAIAGFGILLALLYLSPDSFLDFTSQKEEAMFTQRVSNGLQSPQQIESIRSQIIDYRESIFREDVFRTAKYIFLAVILLLLFLGNKLKKRLFIVLLGSFILIDLWSIDKTFINNKKAEGTSRSEGKYVDWQKATKKTMPFAADVADKQILANEIKANPDLAQLINQKIQEEQAESGRLDAREIEDIQYSQLMRNTHYRVLNTTDALDVDSRTAYFHKSLGGYHGAKLERYQEVVDFKLGIEHYQLKQTFLQGGIQAVQQALPYMNTVNMLNAKYIIGLHQSQKQGVLNPYALGNAWFINKLEVVENADSAILALRELKPSNTAVVIDDYYNAYNEQVGLSLDYSLSNSSIQLLSYFPDELKYKYQTSTDAFVVFSEIYYEKGWQAYVNGKKVEHTRVNFILRGMELPAGSGEVIFKFEPQSYVIATKLIWVSTILFILAIGSIIYFEWKKRKEES